MELKQVVRRALSVAAGFSVLAVASASSAQTSFDGFWFVEIVAKASACSLAYSVAIRVADGKISYAGLFDAVANGNVGNDGELQVQLAHSGDVVKATGALRDHTGFEHWSSATLECEGTWSARRG